MIEVGRRLVGSAECLGEEAEAGFAIGVTRERRLAVVAALGEPVSGAGRSDFCGPGLVFGASVYSWVSEGKNLSWSQAGWQALVSHFVAEKLREMHARRFLRR